MKQNNIIKNCVHMVHNYASIFTENCVHMVEGILLIYIYIYRIFERVSKSVEVGTSLGGVRVLTSYV